MLVKIKNLFQNNKETILITLITGFILLIIENDIFPFISRVMDFKISIRSILIFICIMLVLILRRNNLNKYINNIILEYRKDEYKGNLLIWDYEKNVEDYTVSNLKIFCNSCESEVDILNTVDDGRRYVIGCNCGKYLMETYIDEYNLFFKEAEKNIYDNIRTKKLKIKNKNHKII